MRTITTAFLLAAILLVPTTIVAQACGERSDVPDIETVGSAERRLDRSTFVGFNPATRMMTWLRFAGTDRRPILVLSEDRRLPAHP